LWISEIELTNFKSYRHAKFDFPQPAEGKNIVLIGGMNGYGKTSILEALYLCLYGKDAMSHLARAGLKTDDYRGYPTFLERALNGEAKRDGTDTMSVRIVIHRSPGNGIDIRRRWYFRSTSWTWHEEETIVRDIRRNVLGVPRNDGTNNFHLSELLDEQFVPAHIAPFFFFDGEEVKKLADQTRVEQVKQGLEGLLGVVLLRSLAERLKSFETGKRSGISSVDQANIQALLKMLTDGEARLNAIDLSMAESNQRLAQLKTERESYIERVTSAGGGGGDIATVKDLVEEREQMRTEHRNVQKKLEKLLADKLPFNLMPRGLLDDFKSQLQKEIALEAWQQERRALIPKRQKFEDAFFENADAEIEPALTEVQLASIRERIEAAWESLFYPAPANCATELAHAYLTPDFRARAIQFMKSISVGQQEIQELLSQQRNINERVNDLNRKIARVEGIDRDGTLAELKNNLARVSREIDDLDTLIRNSDREHMGIETGVSNTRARYLQEKKRLDETSPVRQLLTKSERVRSVIEEVIPSLFPLKVAALSQAMTRVYKQLAHKSQVAEIIVGNDGTTKILGKTGKELIFDRSAGENQIFATALIAGLAEVSGVRAPMVVDTPLGRLDSRHRENIFKFWISNPKRQVILLSQDKEIDAEFFSKIEKNVGATYLLVHTDVGDGIGRTVASAKEYFGVAA
jgi:DNA sulfur modification protein DndD